MSRSEKLKKPEINYREYDALSYSALAKYCKNRIGYYMQYILKDEQYIEKERIKMLNNSDVKMGNLIDILQTDPDNYSNLYYESTLTNIPESKTQMYKFVHLMFKNRDKIKTVKENLEISYETLKEENGGKLGTGFSKFVENFFKEGQDYYDELINSSGKVVITKDEYDKAYKASQKINFAFKDPDGEVYTKFPILFEYMGRKFKCEIDKFIINHGKKVVYLYDYKKSSFIETFIIEQYLKLFYYIQGGLYKYALNEYIKKEYKGYSIENMAFRVMDSEGIYDSLTYQMTEDHYRQAFSGFYVGNRYYKGIDQIISEIEINEKEGTWSKSAENIINQGIIKLPYFKYMINE